MNSSGQHGLQMALGRGGTLIIDSRSPNGLITTPTWHHVATVGDGSHVTFYVDGVTYSGSGTMTTLSSGDATRAVDLGWDNFGSYFGGQLDELAFYNRALNASEIQAIYNAGAGGRCALVSVNEPRSPSSKLGFGLACPNPTSQGVHFEIHIPLAATVNARVVDVSGRLVSTLVENGEMSAGSHRLQWDGRDASGKNVVPGIYLLRIAAGSGSAVQRIVMLK